MFGKLFGKSQTHKVNHKFWKWVQNNCSCVEFKPEKIKAWSELKKLELRSNDLSDLSDDISILTGLVDLSLSGNKFSIVPEIVFSLNELMFLNFGVNQISELPNGIGRLKKLKILDLGENKLISLPSEIGELKNLETLILNNNMLTSLPKEIGNMTALNQIYIWDNNLSSLPDEIMNLNNLESIDLQNNNFTNEDSKKWTDRFSNTKCRISFGYQKCNISDPIYAEKNIDGGSVEDSFSAIYLDSQYRDTVSAIFKWSNLDEDDFFSAMIANDRYNKIIVNEGLNAFDSENNIVPIYMALNAETPSTEDELIQWVKIAYIQICDEYNLEPNSKLKIITVGTSGNKKTITMMEY
ncbi:MAG: leucine-rich repeat domain-containing protein [Thiocapsa sp.]|uniref:leucine-rich repeat domain-containing protein n=1 Tax=Thiocapsa sp. TaxID=2024551 RepID=UPI001BCDDF6B|nr:leucine-rich repeat domain-containing protein [Thiocapsa sp.]QVL49540.1 MAG: leucine-rich repeat domain-containing protein [Thiocapsa sp.]